MKAEDFERLENITSGIELAAFTAPCNRYFTLDEKISLFLDSMMKIYNIPKEDRDKTIDKILALDYVQISKDMFDRFVERFNPQIKNKAENE